MVTPPLHSTTVWVSAGGAGGAGGGGEGGGAIACVELDGDVDAALDALRVARVAVGRTVLRRVPVGPGLVDDAVIGRWSRSHATVMTHGGAAVVAGFIAACRDAGLTHGGPAPVGGLYVEADGDLERAMLAAIARAASPVAVDLLLDQPRRWRGVALRAPDERDRLLNRLIEPALVVAVGPPNIGKSSLLNALAGRGVSVVDDARGTTRDHVGALIDLAGVVVRWVDTPGLEEGRNEAQSTKHKAQMKRAEEWDDSAIQAEAQRLALLVAARADVLVLCGDATASIDPPPTAGVVLRIGLRDDLGPVAGGVGVVASASVTSGRGGRGGKGGRGVDSIVRAVREAVVPEALLSDGRPWVFWGEGETRP